MIFLIYNIIISSLVFIFSINYFINFIYFKDISSYRLPKEILMKNPLISILIPARNEKDNIKECLMSLVDQDYKNTEILVLDDNSSDNTSKVVKKIYNSHSEHEIIDQILDDILYMSDMLKHKKNYAGKGNFKKAYGDNYYNFYNYCFFGYF